MDEQTLCRATFIAELLLCFWLATLPCCSGDGEGKLVLDESVYADQTQTLLLEIEGPVAGIELALPFDPGRTLSDRISVSMDETATPEGTHMEYVVKEEEGLLKLAILSAEKNGFAGQDLRLNLQYTLFAYGSGQKLFDQVEIVKVLDAAFNRKEITWRWTHPQ